MCLLIGDAACHSRLQPAGLNRKVAGAQCSQFLPTTLGRHWHWPPLDSHTPLREPWGSHWHAGRRERKKDRREGENFRNLEMLFSCPTNRVTVDFWIITGSSKSDLWCLRYFVHQKHHQRSKQSMDEWMNGVWFKVSFPSLAFFDYHPLITPYKNTQNPIPEYFL